MAKATYNSKRQGQNVFDQVYENPHCTQKDKNEYTKVIRDFIEDIPEGVEFTPTNKGLLKDY